MLVDVQPSPAHDPVNPPHQIPEHTQELIANALSSALAMHARPELIPSYLIPGAEQVRKVDAAGLAAIDPRESRRVYVTATLASNNPDFSVEKCARVIERMVELNSTQQGARVVALQLALDASLQTSPELFKGYLHRIGSALAEHQVIVLFEPHFTSENTAALCNLLKEYNAEGHACVFGLKVSGTTEEGKPNPQLGQYAGLAQDFGLPLRMSNVQWEDSHDKCTVNDFLNMPAALAVARCLNVSQEVLLKIVESSDYERLDPAHPSKKGGAIETGEIAKEPVRKWPPVPQPAPQPVTSYPLGATVLKDGVHFSLVSHHATAVDLCLFDSAADKTESARIPMVRSGNGTWSIYLPELKAGQLYAFRASGPYQPENALFFNPKFLLVDPNAKAIARDTVNWDPNRFVSKHPDQTTDNAAIAPLSVVIDDSAFDWEGDTPPAINARDAVIIELNVKGASALHEGVPEKQRGTFAGLVSDAMLAEMKGLGNHVEIMPPAAGANEGHLIPHNLQNLWNYNTVAFNAPHPKYCATELPVEQVAEFKEMVKKLHKAGFKVIVDVVYNHTAEGNPYGPTISLRGIDRDYYVTGPRGHYIDYTGCGNSLNMDSQNAQRLVLDSLRYWVKELHVDGFRFDEAVVLGVNNAKYRKDSNFFRAVASDPILRDKLMIAEPWSVGPFGQSYQLGQFPNGWMEWNGRFRDEIRSFWRGTGGGVNDLATRFFGSSDLYQWSGRSPQASVNFVTAHDGFTLDDLWSYNQKHNLANQENNRDGIDNNVSWNCGVEGPTDNPEVNRVRLRLQRNSMATLLLASGVPMVCLGDAILHTQGGNNNAYCQNNAISWLNWNLDARRGDFRDFMRGLYALRQAQPVLRRTDYDGNKHVDGTKLVTWMCANGNEMNDQDWKFKEAKTLGLRLSNKDLLKSQPQNAGDSLLVLFNAHSDTVPFVLPGMPGEQGGKWEIVMDTSDDKPFAGARRYETGRAFSLRDRSMVVMKWVSAKQEEAERKA